MTSIQEWGLEVACLPQAGKWEVSDWSWYSSEAYYEALWGANALVDALEAPPRN
jgi:hypothetical protein